MATINLQGLPVQILLGENTQLAAHSANAAQAWAEGTLPGGAGTQSALEWAADAAIAAAYAEEFSGQVYASTSAGVTATPVGQFFRVAIGTTPETYNRYERTGTSPFYRLAAPLATTTALAATGGAALIGSTLGGTVQVQLSSAQARFDANNGTGPLVIVIAGQSNARGANTGGPNPSNANVRTWDAVTGAWVAGGQYTALPWTRDEPNGNLGNNNFALGAAHELQPRTGRQTYIVMDADGGQSITQWVPSTQPRYAALKAKIEAALATLSGKTTIDMLIWAQGEENSSDPVNRMDYATYFDNLSDLNAQLRAESWFTKTTPVFAMGMSTNYDKFAPQQAIRQYCGKVNQSWTYVSMKGLTTVFDETGAGDATHWTGNSLWHGGQRIAYAWISNERSAELPGNTLWGNNTGEAQPGDQTVIVTFDHLVSWDSRDKTTAAITSHSAIGSIAWGKDCVADGNYTFALGEGCTTGAAANYVMVCGKEVTADTGTNYSGGFGYQNTFTGSYYAFAAGRNHVMNGTYGAAAFGFWSMNAMIGGSPLLLRVGNGTSDAARSNAFSVTESGLTYQKPMTVASLPAGTAAGVRSFVTDANATTFASIVAGGGSTKVPVYSDGTNWRIG